jgi:PAS domain S-box-containing protein
VRDSEEQFRLLVESLRDYAIFILDPDGHLTDWNVGAEHIFGYLEEEIVGKDFSIVFTPEDARRGVPERELRQAVAEGRVEAERWHMRKDGSRFWAGGLVVPMRDEADNLRGFTMVAHDLTERKLAAQALHENEEYLRATFEQAAVGIGHVAPDGRLLRVNQKLCEILGYSRRELLEKTFQDITHPDDLDADLGYVRRLLADEIETYSMEKRYFKKDGSMVWVESAVSLVREPSGDPKYFIAIAKDVTGYKEAEKKLREAEKRYRTLVENIPAVTYIQKIAERGSGGTNVTMYASPQIEAQSGYPPRAFEEDPELWIKLLHPEDRERVLAEDARTDETGEPFRMEYRLIARNGDVVWIRDEAVLVRDEEGRPLFWQGVQLDITERKRAEEALRESNKRIEDVLESITEQFFALDREWRYIYINERAVQRIQQLKGEDLTREEILGKSAWELFPELVGSIFYHRFHTAVREQETIHFEAYSPLGERWYEVHLYPSEEGLSVYNLDITDRKQTENELRRSEERFRGTFEQAAVGIGHVAPDGRLLRVNQKLCEILGYSCQELLGKTFQDITHPDDLDADLEYVRRLLAGEIETYSMEKRYFKKDGSIVWVNLTVSLVREPSGEPSYFISCIEDITTRKGVEKEIEWRTHQQAAVAELGLRALASNDLQYLMDDAVGVVARTLDVEYCKIVELLPGGEELLLRAGVGWKEGLIGSWREDAGSDSQAGYTLLSGEPVIMEDIRTETRFRPPPLLRELGVHSGITVVIHGRDEPFGVLGAHTKSRRTFTEDDTNFLQAVANVLAAAVERKRAEEASSEVREAERSRIARDLHDEALRDLSDALVEAQYVQSISQDSKPVHRLGRLVAALKRAGQHLRGAIYNLRLESEDDRPFDEMLGSLVELHRSMTPDLDIRLKIQDGVLSGPLGETGREVLRIVGEALTNARRHSKASNVRVAVNTSETVDKLWVEVEDDGRGFDPTQEPPATSIGGTGIRGMRERARLLGGDLTISSEPGRGTKVRFDLDLKKEPQEPQEEVRILLVDDHASFRDALATVFEQKAGFEVAGLAGSLAEARQMLNVLEAEPVDVAVIDLGLPDGYGGDLIKDLRETSPRAQALILSANLDRTQTARAVESGAAGVVHKAVEMDEVIDAVQRLSAGETLLPLGEVVELLRFAGSRKDEAYEARQTIALLTPREKEVLQALADGLDSQEIAKRLQISVKTERNHVASIMAKLRVHSRLQALVVALRHGVVKIS